MRWVFLIAMFLGLFSDAEAGKMYVRANGSDINDGSTVALAKKTIKTALAVVAENDTLYIMDDDGPYTWTDQGAANMSGWAIYKNRLLLGEIGGDAIIDWEGNNNGGTVAITQTNTARSPWAMENLTFKNVTPGLAYFLYQASTVVGTVTDCVFDSLHTDNYAGPYAIVNYQSATGGTLTFDGCKFINMVANSFYVFRLSASGTFIITNSEFGDPYQTYGAGRDTLGYGGGIYNITSADSIYVGNCTFYSIGHTNAAMANCGGPDFTNCNGNDALHLQGDNVGVYDNTYLRQKGAIRTQNHRLHDTDFLVTTSANDGIQVYRNYVVGAGHGINLSSDNANVYYNVVSETFDDSYVSTATSSVNVYRYNVSHNTNDNGWDDQGDDNVFEYGTIIGTTSEVRLEDTTSNSTFRYNIVYDVRGSTNEFLDLFAGATSPVVEYNVYYDPDGSADRWNSLLSADRTWAQWQSDGYDVSGMNSDPRLWRPLSAPTNDAILRIRGQSASRPYHYSPMYGGMRTMDWVSRYVYPGAYPPYRGF
jgi:hypothetical protein